jgi:hypothetical protein
MSSAIVALTLDPERRARLALGARATAVQLDWEAELDRLDASYRAVLEQASRESKRRPRTTDIFEEPAATSAPV